MKRYEYLDALRGIAILLVLLAHTAFNFYFPSVITDNLVIKVGPSGVQLFYLLSAFTLSLAFTRHIQKEKNPIRNFYIRRFFRIAPLFYLVIIFALFQNDFFGKNPSHFSWADILTTITFTNGFFPKFINSIILGQWSIADEAIFYVLFPFLFYKIRSAKQSFIIFAIVCVVVQLLRLYVLHLPVVAKSTLLQIYSFQFFLSQLPLFLLGMTLYLGMHEKNIFKKEKKLFYISLSIFIIILILQFLFHIKLIAGHYIFGIWFAGLLYFLSKFPIKIIVNPIVAYIGRISFSIYLTHVFVLAQLSSTPLFQINNSPQIMQMILRYGVVLLCSSIVSSVLYFVVEIPGQHLGKKIISILEKNDAKIRKKPIIPVKALARAVQKD